MIEKDESGKYLLISLDWKQGKIYQEYVLQRKNNK